MQSRRHPAGHPRLTDPILFDRDEVEHLNSLAERPRRLRGTQLLWVDLRRGEDAEELARAFNLTKRTREYLEAAHDTAVFQDFGHYIHITSYAPREDDDEGELQPIECVVGQNWMLTAHTEPMRVLDEFAERVSGSGNT
jgi:Mg2+ and Co2+ transporter CorA